MTSKGGQINKSTPSRLFWPLYSHNWLFLAGEARAMAAVLQGELEQAVNRVDAPELTFAIKNHLDYIQELFCIKIQSGQKPTARRR